jgi:hypothetical protein
MTASLDNAIEYEVWIVNHGLALEMMLIYRIPEYNIGPLLSV